MSGALAFRSAPIVTIRAFGQPQREGCAAIDTAAALRVERATNEEIGLSATRQAETSAAACGVAGGSNMHERPEDMRQFLRRKARSGVVNADGAPGAPNELAARRRRLLPRGGHA